LLAIVPLGLMAGGPEDHFTGSRELYGLVEGDEWARVEPLIPTPVTGPAVCATRQLARAGRESRDRAVVPSAAELVEQLEEIARLRAEGALTESEFEAVKARLLSAGERARPGPRRRRRVCRPPRGDPTLTASG
jgi:putative oligomerization/nucleic acid binding protein